MNEEVKSPITPDSQEFKKLVSDKDPEALALLEQFSKAAVAGDGKARSVIDFVEKKTLANITNSTAQKIHDALNDAHKQDFEKAVTIDKVLEIIDQQIRQHQNVIGLFESNLIEPQMTGDLKKDQEKAAMQARLTPAMRESMKKRIKAEKEKIDKLESLVLEMTPPPAT